MPGRDGRQTDRAAVLASRGHRHKHHAPALFRAASAHLVACRLLSRPPAVTVRLRASGPPNLEPPP